MEKKKENPDLSRPAAGDETPPPSRPGSEFQTLDLEALLKPISSEDPCGEFLRYTQVYDHIQEARREDDPGLPQGVWERELKKADWPKVRELCLVSLLEQTKDIQIAAWLMESLLHLHGFAGVREGLRLILGLGERFWDNLYPPLGEDDLDDRIAPFIWINEKLSIKLKFRPITHPQSVDAHPYTYYDWERVTAMDKLSVTDADAAEKAESEGRVTRAKFLGSVMFSPRRFYIEQNEELKDCLNLLTDLNRFLKEKCETEYPSLGRFRDILDDIRRLTWKFLSEKDNNHIDSNDTESDEFWEHPDPENPEEESRSQPSYLSIRNRSEAYRMLNEAADYLLIHEPHSPTPYLVKRAVSWGHMTLNELLQELISDDQNLSHILTLLGLKKPDHR